MDSLFLFAAVVPNITALLTATSLRRKHNVNESISLSTVKWIFNNVLNVKDYFAPLTGVINNRHTYQNGK
jgi:hypothetical protein